MRERYIIPAIFDQEIGVIYEGKNKVEFQYFKEFDGERLPISPFRLPFAPDRVFNYYDSMAFNGLPGIFADSLPDSFGNILMQRYFEQKLGAKNFRISVLDKLAYIGTNSVGAIEYYPPENEEFEFIGVKLKEYIKSVREIIEGSSKEAIKEVVLRHPSPGGARPKASVLWNRKKDIMKIGSFVDEDSNDFEYWIVKFDEKDKEFTKIEYAYMLLAKKVGIDITDIELITTDNETHFAVKRFDRNFMGEKKLHKATLAGLLHKDFTEQGASSYEEYFKIVFALTKDFQSVKEAFKRMVFNVVGRNCDDHLKNFSFLMNSKGEWRLSPAYDLIYSYGKATFGEHKISINKKTADIELNDLAQCGYGIGLEKNFMKEAIEEISETFSNIDKTLSQIGVSKKSIEEFKKSVKLFSVNNFPDKKVAKKRKSINTANELAKRILLR